MSQTLGLIIIGVFLTGCIVGIVFLIRKNHKLMMYGVKGKKNKKTITSEIDYGFNITLKKIGGYVSLVIVLGVAIISLYELINWKSTLERTFISLIIVWKILERPIYIAGLLYILYLLVRFIKRARNHDDK